MASKATKRAAVDNDTTWQLQFSVTAVLGREISERLIYPNRKADVDQLAGNNRFLTTVIISQHLLSQLPEHKSSVALYHSLGNGTATEENRT